MNDGAGAIELCFRAIQDGLETIRIENGYRHDVKKVYRTFEPAMMENLDSLASPALMLGRTPGQDASFSNYDDRGYGVTVPTSIVGYLKRGSDNAEDDLASTRAEAFLSDIERRIMTDPEWGTDKHGSGHIQNSKILATEHGAAWDSSGIFVEVRMEFYTEINAVNP